MDPPMTAEARARLRAQLLEDEGVVLKPYTDTVGKLTIGVGRNLTDVGISQHEAMVLLENDINRAIRDVAMEYPWFLELDPVRQTVIVNMAFNMGATRLRKFVNTLGAVARGDYAAAAKGMRASLWYRQVGARARRLIRMMDTGEWLP